MEIKVLGKIIGEAAGWEDIDLNVIQFTDVTFSEEHSQIFDSHEANSIVVNYDEGIIQVYNYENDGSTEYYRNFKIITSALGTDNVHHYIEDISDDADEETSSDTGEGIDPPTP